MLRTDNVIIKHFNGMHALSSIMFTATSLLRQLWVYCSALHSEGYSIGAKRLHCGVVSSSCNVHTSSLAGMSDRHMNHP